MRFFILIEAGNDTFLLTSLHCITPALDDVEMLMQRPKRPLLETSVSLKSQKVQKKESFKTEDDMEDLEAQVVKLEWSTSSPSSVEDGGCVSEALSPRERSNHSCRVESDTSVSLGSDIVEVLRLPKTKPSRHLIVDGPVRSKTAGVATSWIPSTKVDWQESDADIDDWYPLEADDQKTHSAGPPGFNDSSADRRCRGSFSRRVNDCSVRIVGIVPNSSGEDEPDVQIVKVSYHCDNSMRDRPWRTGDHMARETRLSVGLRTAAATYPKELLQFFLDRELLSSKSLNVSVSSVKRICGDRNPPVASEAGASRPGFDEFSSDASGVARKGSCRSTPVIDRSIQTPSTFQCGVTHNHYEGASFYLMVSDLDPDAQDLGCMIHSIARQHPSPNPSKETT